MPTQTSTVRVEGQRLEVAFDHFGLTEYDLFIRCKKLPEYQVAYDWQLDRYIVTAPARFARMLGVETAVRDVGDLPIARHLFDYQAWALGLALDARRFAAWFDTGLGKTALFLEYARQVVHRTGGRVLILEPLQVIEQTREEALLGPSTLRGRPEWTPWPYPQEIERLDSRETLIEWCQGDGPAVGITNYEKLIPGRIGEFRNLAGIVADESSILKTGGGKIKWNLIHSAKGVEHKLSCTATPAPNEAMEYASQASFLEKIRNEGDIIWTYFVKEKNGDWRIRPHAQQAFYRFMASWSVYLRDPAHYGFADILSTLPPPDVREYEIPLTETQRDWMFGLLAERGKGLIPEDGLGVQERSKLSQYAKGFCYTTIGGKRQAVRIDSLKPAFVADLVRADVADGRQVLVWTIFDEESAIVAEQLRGAPFAVATLDGSMSDAARQVVLDRFRRGDVQVLVSKAQLIGFGMNFQHCTSMVFSGFDDSFERLYQAIRRCYRFGQREVVRVHIPYIPELEGMIWGNVRHKQSEFDRQTALQERFYREAAREVAA